MLKVLQSSVNPQKLSLAIGAGLSTLLIFLGFLGYDNLFNVSELTAVIMEVIEGILVISGGIATLIGVVRKLYVIVNKIINKLKK